VSAFSSGTSSRRALPTWVDHCTKNAIIKGWRGGFPVDRASADSLLGWLLIGRAADRAARSGLVTALSGFYLAQLPR